MKWQFREFGWRVLPGSLIALLGVALLHSGWLTPLEQAAYRTLFTLRGKQPWDDRLVLVTIDDASLQKIGRFPWSRQQYVRLLNTLAQANPSVVGMDIIFAEPSPDDGQLSQAIAQNGRVVLAGGYDRGGQPLAPVPALQSAAIATGHVAHFADSDAITRSVPLSLQNQSALGVAMVQTYALVHERVPLPESQFLWLNWTGSAQTIPQYSFVDVVEKRVSPQVFKDKIVLVGVTASAIDPMITPFDRNPPAYGLALQATLIDNLLRQKSLTPLPPWSSMVLICLGAPLLSLLLSTREQWRVLGWAVVCLGWVGGSVVVFKAGTWMPIALPLTVITLTTIARSASDRLRTHRLLQTTTRQFQSNYPSPAILPAAPPPQALQELSSLIPQNLQQLAELANQFGQMQSTQSAIAQSLPTGLLAADLNGSVWFCNGLAAEWLQVDIGENLATRLVPNWFTPHQWQAALQRLSTNHEPVSSQIQQGDRWFELQLKPLQTGQMAQPDSSIYGLLLVLEEITAEKQTADSLESRVQQLLQLSELKDDFLNTVSHELRSPMTNIQMAIELLKRTNPAKKATHYLQILQNEAAREIDLINDLLDLQRLEAGAQTFHSEEIQLQNWLPSVIHPFYERTQAQQQTLQIALSPELPKVLSDEASLERVITELVNNACKYTPPGEKITVAVQALTRTEWQDEGGDRQTKDAEDAGKAEKAREAQIESKEQPESDPPSSTRPLVSSSALSVQSSSEALLSRSPHLPGSSTLQISVCNSGTEIPQQELGQIFEKFYRVPQADVWKRGGTGLGLSLVKKLVESLGGTIQVSSAAGETVFTVQLPLDRPQRE
jgi:signal transduction histidine kinase